MGLLSGPSKKAMQQVAIPVPPPTADQLKQAPAFMPPMTPPPIPQGPGQDFFRYRIESLDIIDEITHQLKGEVLIPDGKGGGEYKEKFDRWINDEGINKILHLIYSNGLNKNVFLGNLTHEEIMFKMRSLKKRLALLIFQKYDAFEIKKEMRSLIVTTVINQIHSGLSRCEGGREADQLSSATTRLESYAIQDKQKQGMMEHIPFWRKK